MTRRRKQAAHLISMLVVLLGSGFDVRAYAQSTTARPGCIEEPGSAVGG